MNPTLATLCLQRLPPAQAHRDLGPIKPWAGSRFQPLIRLRRRHPLGLRASVAVPSPQGWAAGVALSGGLDGAPKAWPLGLSG